MVNMDLSNFFSPPVVVAFFAGIFFLHRAWKPKAWKGAKGFTSPSAHEESAVSKESDFPSDWWKGTATFELERRGIFSKVRTSPRSHLRLTRSDMALHRTSQPIHQTRRLQVLRTSRVPHLPDSGQRQPDAGFPQRMPA